jgi:hypothetical protein
MNKVRSVIAVLALVGLIGVACGGDEEPVVDEGAEVATDDPAGSPGEPGGDPEAQMNAILACLQEAGFSSAFPTNTLFGEERRITMDPPYTLIYIYADTTKIESDIPKIEDNSGSGSSIETEGNVLVSYQVNPKDDAGPIEECAFGA